MSLQIGSQRTRGTRGPENWWEDEEDYLAQRGEFTRAGHGVPDDFARYSSRYSGYQGEQTGWPREWPHLEDAAYAQWRDEELRKFDEEYEAWRSERYRRFADEFEDWRRNRSQARSGE